jgi:hypothetical protein
MADDTAVPMPIGPDWLASPLKRLTEIPEEEICCRKQKSARKRRAYRLDVQHVVPTTLVTTALKDGAQLEDVQKAAGIGIQARPSSTGVGTTRRRPRAFFATYSPVSAVQ